MELPPKIDSALRHPIISKLVSAAIITVAGIVLWKAKGPKDIDPTTTTIVSSGDDAVIQGPGSIHVDERHGIDAERFQRLSEDYGVQQAALRSFFAALEQQQVPPHDLDATLRSFARQLRDLRRGLSQPSSSNPAVANLKRSAARALDDNNYEQAAALLKKASELDSSAAEQYGQLAKDRMLSAAELMSQAGDATNLQFAYADAAAYYKQAVRLVSKDNPLIAARYLQLQGSTLLADHRFSEAESPLMRALEIREAELGPGHLDVADSLSDLAVVYSAEGQHSKAAPLASRALEIRESILQPNHLDIASSLDNVAVLYFSQRRFDEAESLYKRALAVRESVLRPNDHSIATTLHNLATLYETQGKLGDAEPLIRRALEIRENHYETHPLAVAVSLNSLAGWHYQQSQYEAAEPLMLRALEIYEARLGPEHPALSTTLENLARLYKAMGRRTDAMRFLMRVLAIRDNNRVDSETVRSNGANSP